MTGSIASALPLPPSPAGTGPTVDVIISNYNYGRFLPAAIESALRQDHPGVRVIVVDDGSSDDSASVIAAFGSRIVSIAKQNGGQASAMNAGFRAGTGQLVLFLDADDVLHPSVVSLVVGAFAAEPAAAKVQFCLEVIDAVGVCTGERKPSPHLPLPSGDVAAQELQWPFDMVWMSMSGNAFPRWALDRLLPVPEAEYPINADWYLQHLTPLLGPVVSLASVGGQYRVHGGNSYEVSSDDVDLGHVRQSVRYAAITRRHLCQLADDLSMTRPAEILSVADLANRMISLRLDGPNHPLPDDRVGSLARKGWQASARRTNVSWTMRLLFATWFLVMGWAPRALARQLALRFLFPQRRPVLNRVLGRLHRLAPTPS